MDAEQFLDQPVLGFFSNGSFCSNGKREKRDLVSPLTNQHWKTLVQATKEDTQEAIEKAKEAFSSWKALPAFERSSYLRKIGTLLNENKEIFANLMAKEMGKPVQQGRAEVLYSSSYFFWFAAEAERIYGITVPSKVTNKRLFISYEPVGVCAAITPWNFPLAMAARKIAAALAAGCTIINKPSPESPLTMLLFAQICKMADLPPGVLSILAGEEFEIGKALLESNTVRKISFTGSTEVGKYFYEKSAPTLKKLTLELGGNAPLIVFDDADIPFAVKETIKGKFRNNGQTCICPNRVLIQETIYEDFTAQLIEGIRDLKLGDPLDESSDLSAVLHPASQEKVKRHIEDAEKKGAIAEHIGGEEPHYPCVLVDALPNMTIYREETFGPVIPLFKFKTDEEGIDKANDSDYGLASYIFTKSLSRGAKAIEALQYGIVGLNDGAPSAPEASFGGIKHSGIGREGGPTGLREYMVEKFVSTYIA